MGMKISNTEMTSEETPHTAAVVPGAVVEGGPPAAGQEPQTADGALLELAVPERLGLINAMTDHERSVLLAYIAGRAPWLFADAITSRSASFADELFGRIEERDQAEYMAEPDGYCTVCGENASWFVGYEGPQHFRGPHKLVTGAERRELFTPDDGHAPQVVWRYPDTAQDQAGTRSRDGGL